MRKRKFNNAAAIKQVQELADRLKIPYRHTDVRKPCRVERRLEINATDDDLVSVKLGVADSAKSRPIGGGPDH
jgi:hypothetical protein